MQPSPLDDQRSAQPWPSVQKNRYPVNIYKKIAIAGVALIGLAAAHAQTYTGAQGTGWREIAVPVAPSDRVSIQSASPGTADHASVLLQIDDATGLANAPLPQVVKDNLLRDGLGDNGVMVDRDLANSIADGTAATKYAQWINGDSGTTSAFNAPNGTGTDGKKTIQRVTAQGLFCSSGWQPYTVTQNFDTIAKSLSKNISGGTLRIDGAAAVKGTANVVIEYKRSDWSGCIPYAFRLQGATAVGTIDMANSRLALTASVAATVAQDSVSYNLYSYSGHFTIGYLVVWYDVNVPLELGYKAMVGASGTVDYSSQMSGVVPFNYTCVGHSCTGTSDTSKLAMTSSTPNLGVSADVVVDPYVMVSVKGRLYPIGNTALASVGVGLKLSAPLELYGYYGNACGDSNADGTNEMLNTYFIDLQARLSLQVTWALIDHEGSAYYGNGDWASNKISGALYRVLNSEGKVVPLWHTSLYYKDWSPGNASVFSPILRLQSSYINGGKYNYVVRTSMRPCVALDTNYIVTTKDQTGAITSTTVAGKAGYTDTTYTSTATSLSLTPTGVHDDVGRVFNASTDIAPAFVYMGTGFGTFQYVSITRTAAGNSGDIASITVKNVGTGTIAGLASTCSGQSFHSIGTLPAVVAPGATVTVQCQAAGSGSYAAPAVTLTGTNASNSPFKPY